MAKREAVAYSILCRMCRKQATLELVSRYGDSVGNYCVACAKQKLKELSEPEKGLTSQ